MERYLLVDGPLHGIEWSDGWVDPDNLRRFVLARPNCPLPVDTLPLGMVSVDLKRSLLWYKNKLELARELVRTAYLVVYEPLDMVDFKPRRYQHIGYERLKLQRTTWGSGFRFQYN